MGYTHYWKSMKIGKTVWQSITTDVKKLFKNLPDGLEIAGGDGTGEPIVNDSDIILNGVESKDEDYETFYFSIVGTDFSFTKTARRPYDIVVQAVLIIIKHHSNEINVSSDGEFEEWTGAVNLVNGVLGYGEHPFTNEEE